MSIDKKEVNTMDKINAGYISRVIIRLIIIVLFFSFSIGAIQINKAYEYTTLTIDATTDYKLEGSDLIYQSSTSVIPSNHQLNVLGYEGWDIVSTYFENETVFHNFGNTEYVLGIRSNTRPKRLVIILKRCYGITLKIRG